MARVFVIRPFGKKKDSSEKEIDFDRIDQQLITPALQAAGLDGGTTGEIVDAGNIREDMFALILEADLVVCDITVHNANVFYELGIRHALRKKHTVMIKGGPTSDKPPFDLSTDRYFTYKIYEPEASVDALTDVIRASMNTVRDTDSPIFQMLPDLSEADPAEVVVVPPDFGEEVKRARAAKSKGWLRLLAEEVQGERFQWEGLKWVATVQWEIEDYDGARESWEHIRKVYPDDIDANLAAANIYERLYRKTGNVTQLEISEQAIGRVLKNRSATRRQKAEAKALQGRNQKTLWRTKLGKLSTAEQRRHAALNRALLNSYEAYQKAYFEDLNHFYSGLTALQMGTILLEFVDSESWLDLFLEDREAKSYREELDEMVPKLRCLVSTAVKTALSRTEKDDPERVWAEISEADVLFLTNPARVNQVIRAYRDAIPLNHPFAWGSVKGQLQLFADLGIQANLANAVIQELDPRFANTQLAKPTHLVIFAGHSVDLPGRSTPRFPEEQEAQATALIRQALTELKDGQHDVVVLASGAPGADIIAHEVCAELGLRSILCLPMPAEAVVPLAFQGLDTWRSRFLNLWEVHKQADRHLILSDQPGLPQWLHRSGVNSWERGNKWVIELAESWNADKRTLLAFWDGKKDDKKTSDKLGGTAHMMSLAEQSGTLHISRIDSTQILRTI
jgi:hypothetical protein